MFDIGFPRDWSSLKKLIWLKAAISGGGASAVWKTVTGTLIHITDALASPMQKCEVTLEPIQDLHGQDAPYPAGGGVNKLPYPFETASGTSRNNVTFTDSNGAISVNASSATSAVTAFNLATGLVLKAGTYTACISKNITEMQIIFRDPNGGVNLAVLKNGVLSVTFTTAEELTFNIYISIASGNSPSNSNVYVQLVEGPTAPTEYHPYSNICPITGWTGCEVTVDGGNLFNPNSDFPLVNCYNYAQTAQIRRGVIYRLPVGTYTITASGNAEAYLNANVLNKDGSFSEYGSIVSGNNKYAKTVTLADGQYIVIYDQQATTASTETKFNLFNIQLEVGSSASPYKQFNGTTLSVTFPETVYGGKYDFVSGEGDSNLVKLPLLSSYAWQLDIPYGRRFGFPYGSNPSFKKATNKNGTFIGNILAPVNIGVNSHDFGTFYISNSWLVVNDNNSHFNSLEDFKSWLESEDVYIVYEVAEPTEISITPQPISTLKGVNNVWGDGTIEITYKAQAE